MAFLAGKPMTSELLALAQRRKLLRELRRTARRCADEAWLLERAIDGALALKILEEAPTTVGIRQRGECLPLSFMEGTDRADV